MLRLSRFTYHSPSSVAEAGTMLRELGPDATLMAGGTDVLVNIKHRLVTPSHVIGISRLPELTNVEWHTDGWLTLGAGVTLRRIESDPAIAARFSALATSAHLVSTPQVRATATLGGNVCLDVRCNYYNQSFDWRKAIGFCMKKDSEICRVAPGGDRCWAVASADTVPVLVALRAEATVAGEGGDRRVPLETLYQDDGLTPMGLEFGDIVTRIHLPPQPDVACVYQKFRIRGSFDFPLVGIAAAVRRDRAGIVEEARLVMTAVASYPERASAAEAALIGRRLDESTIGAAGTAIFRAAKPMDNTAGTIFHRKRMARVLAERALRALAGIEEPARRSA
ncbi:MAG TPA: FAD binding domain-containing protein [Chloroflexota bacterium]|nr:FAD binding domain-containing protein [Chloroflexota bacterium]